MFWCSHPAARRLVLSNRCGHKEGSRLCVNSEDLVAVGEDQQDLEVLQITRLSFDDQIAVKHFTCDSTRLCPKPLDARMAITLFTNCQLATCPWR